MKKPKTVPVEATVRISAELPASTRKALKDKADSRGMKFSAFVEMILTNAALGSEAAVRP